jgi:uncharacterized protein (PEP-CTERM system associated)
LPVASATTASFPDRVCAVTLAALACSSATSGADITSKEWTARTGLATQFGRRTTGSLESRYTRFNSDAGTNSDYTENALIATLFYQF